MQRLHKGGLNTKTKSNCMNGIIAHLFGGNIALLFHSIMVHENIGKGGGPTGAHRHISQQLSNLRGCPDAKSSLALFGSPWCWERVCILRAVKTARLSKEVQRGRWRFNRESIYGSPHRLRKITGNVFVYSHVRRKWLAYINTQKEWTNNLKGAKIIEWPI